MFKPVLLAARLLSPVLLWPALAAAQDGPGPIHASYSGYAHGFNVVNLDATLALAPDRYRLEIAYNLVGVLGVVIHGDAKTVVNGRFDGAHAKPEDFFSTGHFRGEPRAAQIAWHGGTPAIIQLLPPVEGERDPVPPAEQANTIDTLSAMAALIHEVAQSGKCDSRERTFDGRRLSDISAHTAGMEALDTTSRSVFHGPALRCDFQGRQLGGFRHDADQDEQRRLQAGSAWFAPVVPGAVPLPVRITFDTPQFGEVTMYLTAAR